MIQGSFFNTIELSGKDLAEAEANARNQEQRILYLFKFYKSGTPSQMSNRYDKRWPSVPITSIRRAITNLTENNYLEMTDQMYPGLYGKPEHSWQLKE